MAAFLSPTFLTRLGQTISNGKCDDEILKRISLIARNRIIKAYVWSTLLYGCEAWTITTRNMTKLQSFEMWAYRKMMKISWREKKTNEEFLEMAGEQL